MRTEIVRCDVCALVIGEGQTIVGVMVCEVEHGGLRGAFGVHPARVVGSSPITLELCVHCARKPIDLAPSLDRARAEAEARAAAAREAFGPGGIGFGG